MSQWEDVDAVTKAVKDFETVVAKRFGHLKGHWVQGLALMRVGSKTRLVAGDAGDFRPWCEQPVVKRMEITKAKLKAFYDRLLELNGGFTRDLKPRVDEITEFVDNVIDQNVLLDKDG